MKGEGTAEFDEIKAFGFFISPVSYSPNTKRKSACIQRLSSIHRHTTKMTCDILQPACHHLLPNPMGLPELTETEKTKLNRKQQTEISSLSSNTPPARNLLTNNADQARYSHPSFQHSSLPSRQAKPQRRTEYLSLYLLHPHATRRSRH